MKIWRYIWEYILVHNVPRFFQKLNIWSNTFCLYTLFKRCLSNCTSDGTLCTTPNTFSQSGDLKLHIWKCFASRQCSKALSLNIWSSIWEHTREKHLHVYNVQKLFLMLLIWRVKWKKQSGQKPFACIQQVNVSNGRSDTLLVFISFYSSMIWSFVADSRASAGIFQGNI